MNTLIAILFTVTGEPMALVAFEGAQMLVPECRHEDSDNCYWDAQTRGNGRGVSYYVIDGIITPYESRD